MAKNKNKKKGREEPSVQESKRMVQQPKKDASWMMALVIAALAVFLYANTWDNHYVMDDDAMIKDHNTTHMGYKGISQFFRESSVYGVTKEKYGSYRPLTMATYAFEWQFYKMKIDPGQVLMPPKGQRLTHILMYALCCVVLFYTLRRLLKNYHPLIPFIATLLFTVHPLHTEVAAFIKSRDELLSMIFVFSSLYLLFRWVDTKRNIFLGSSIFLFLLATFSKESAITFVLIFPLCLYFFSNKKTSDILLVSLPYLACALIYMWARGKVLEGNSGYMPVINNPLVEAHGLGERLSVIMYIFLLNIKLLFYPHPLTWYYGYNQFPLKEYSWNNPWVLISLLIHMGLVVAAIWLFRRKNIFSFLIIFYLVSILITSNLFVLIAALMAERFLFIGSIAFCVVIAYLLTKYLGKENTYKFSPPMIAVLAPVLLAFTYMTHERNKDWFDNYTLFKAGAELDDNSFRSYSGYAWQLLDKGQKEQQDSAKRTSWYREARTYYEKAVKVYDKQQNDWFNLGVCYNYFHDTLRAENAFQKAHDINPKIVNASLNLGVIYYQKKDYEKALKYWKEGADYDPNFLTISSNVGLVYWQNFNRPDLAIPYFEKYYQSNPNDFNTVHNLCYAYKAIGNTQKSNEYFAKMQQLKPGSK